MNYTETNLNKLRENDIIDIKINDAIAKIHLETVSQTLAWIRCFTNPLNMTHVLCDVRDKNMIEAYVKQKHKIRDCIRQALKKERIDTPEPISTENKMHEYLSFNEMSNHLSYDSYDSYDDGSIHYYVQSIS